jgi:sulfur relay (sulfurtransferase) complex TusBCD TusD component (DsrE family)
MVYYKAGKSINPGVGVMKFLIIVYSRDPETIWNAFRFASTTMAYDNEVTVFLLGSGVEAPTLGTIKFDIREQIEIFREQGGGMIGCGVCCEIRSDVIPGLETELNCELGSMQQLYALSAEADKILTF